MKLSRMGHEPISLSVATKASPENTKSTKTVVSLPPLPELRMRTIEEQGQGGSQASHPVAAGEGGREGDKAGTNPSVYDIPCLLLSQVEAVHTVR